MAKSKHSITKYLDDDFQMWDAGEGVPTNKDLNALEADLNVTLPEDFRKFQRLHGAILVQASEDVWPRPKRTPVGPFWTFLYGFVVHGVGDGAPDYMDMRATAEQFHEEHPEASHLIPFFANLDTADYHCFDKEGRIWFWSHECPDEPEAIEGTFDQFILAESMHLALRKDAVKKALDDHGKKWREHAIYPERPRPDER